MFGPPQKILSDNGGEFQGEKWESICEAFNTIHRTTAAELPFSNGIYERHNLLIAEMTEKVIEDVGCSLNIALMWAIHAKNSLINIYGFSLKGGKWENYWNVKNLRTDTEIGVNLDEVEWIKDAFAQEINFLADQITWETMVQNYELNKSAEYLKAKENEVEKWKKFNVYEEVNRSEYPNQAVI